MGKWFFWQVFDSNGFDHQSYTFYAYFVIFKYFEEKFTHQKYFFSGFLQVILEGMFFQENRIFGGIIMYLVLGLLW